MSRVRGLAALTFLFAVIAYLIPHPAIVTPQSWRQMAIFVSVIVGMIIEPFRIERYGYLRVRHLQ